jgi:uncharacterized SAM-binding protein YcdF (DUF218 family)
MSLLHDAAHFFRSTVPFSLVPPSGLIWWLLIGLLVTRRRRRLGLTIVALSTVLLYALSTPLVGGLLISSLEAAQPPAPDAGEPGAIIVLGGDGERTPDRCRCSGWPERRSWCGRRSCRC